MTASFGEQKMDMLQAVQPDSLQENKRQIFVQVNSFEEFNAICASAEAKLCNMH